MVFSCINLKNVPVSSIFSFLRRNPKLDWSSNHTLHGWTSVSIAVSGFFFFIHTSIFPPQPNINKHNGASTACLNSIHAHQNKPGVFLAELLQSDSDNKSAEADYTTRRGLCFIPLLPAWRLFTHTTISFNVYMGMCVAQGQTRKMCIFCVFGWNSLIYPHHNLCKEIYYWAGLHNVLLLLL